MTERPSTLTLRYLVEHAAEPVAAEASYEIDTDPVFIALESGAVQAMQRLRSYVERRVAEGES